MKRLDLSCNSIGDAGGELLAEALDDQLSIEYLNLQRNSLRVSSGSMFAQSLKNNDTIKHLKLGDNCITNDFIKVINDKLEKNQAKFEINNYPKLQKERE